MTEGMVVPRMPVYPGAAWRPSRRIHRGCGSNPAVPQRIMVRPRHDQDVPKHLEYGRPAAAGIDEAFASLRGQAPLLGGLDMARRSACLTLLLAVICHSGDAASAWHGKQPPTPRNGQPSKKLPMPGEVFEVGGHTAFL